VVNVLLDSKKNGLYECEDTDECADKTDKCSKDPVRVCMNTGGIYTCGDCPTNYTNDGDYNCTKDVETSNPCIDGTHECKPPRNCSFSTGSVVCLNCPTGYINNGAFDCTDVNECTSGTHKCTEKRPCTNTVGGYKCADCPTGLFNNGPYQCSDVPITVYTDTNDQPTASTSGSNTNTQGAVTTASQSSGAISILGVCLHLVFVIVLFI